MCHGTYLLGKGAEQSQALTPRISQEGTDEGPPNLAHAHALQIKVYLNRATPVADCFNPFTREAGARGLKNRSYFNKRIIK